MSIFSGLIPTPAPFQDKSRAYELKSRLDWGEPALTIVDARSRNAFNESHIMGAVSMPMETLVSFALNTLEFNRDIYIYSDTNEETAAAASYLRHAGYQRISELTGGLAAWKAAGYPLESISSVVA